MDFKDQSVGICYCCIFLTFKHYFYLMMITNAIQGLILMIIGFLGVLNLIELFNFSLPITITLLSLGSFLILGLIAEIFFFFRHSVIKIGRFMVVLNILTSLFDLILGVILLLICFFGVVLIELNDTQLYFSQKRRDILKVISIVIIFISFFGFWMTYLQYQLLLPLHEQIQQDIKIVPVVSLRQAVTRKFSKNFIAELTPNNKQQKRIARADTISEQSQPLQSIQLKSQKNDEMPELYLNQKSEKLIKIPDSVSPYNEYFAPSTNTIRYSNQIEDIQNLRKQRTPRSTYLKQQS
ncbi:unnamed protein product [Paramecium primaurelia]|uniref:Transmembrane protein n=2 Tax=Paramecium TaxID=5884 RepID=A0A8S1SYC4_9CILI|nr:unnamed protein product [Paramecium primaurelia]CAD8143462.1 unnamed protein product [Paramecium pentaurelia]